MKLSKQFGGRIKLLKNRMPLTNDENNSILFNSSTIDSFLDNDLLSHDNAVAINPNSILFHDLYVEIIPDLVSGYRYNFDASDVSSLTLVSTDQVSAWASTGSNTSSAIPTNSAYSPTFVTDVNNGNYLNFVKTQSDGLSIGNGASNLSTPNWHMFAVVNPTTITGDSSAQHAYNNSPIFAFAQFGGIYLASRSSVNYAQAHVHDSVSGHGGAEVSGVVTGSKSIVEGKATGTVVGVALDGGTFTTIAAGSSQLSTSYQTGISQRWHGSSGGFDGKIHQIVVYPDDLNNTDRQQVLSHLSAKWGITIP